MLVKMVTSLLNLVANVKSRRFELTSKTALKTISVMVRFKLVKMVRLGQMLSLLVTALPMKLVMIP